MIPRIEALNELTRLSQETGMYESRTPREVREAGDPNYPLRKCSVCPCMLPVSCFGTNRERIPDKVCKECKAASQVTDRQKRLASRR